MRTVTTRQQRALISLALLFVGLWALGTVGWCGAAPGISWLEAIYRSLQMFSLNFDGVEGEVPPLLQVARFAQPAFTILAFAATVSAELRLLLRSLVSHRAEQITIIGYGVSGKAAAERFRASAPDARLVALDHSVTPADHRAARRNGVELIACDALDAEARRSYAAGLARSSELVIACGSDQTNLSLLDELSADIAGVGRRVRLWLHLSSHALAERLRESYHCPSADTAVVEFVETADHAAQSVVLVHPLVVEARAAGLRRVHAVVHGFDDFGWLVVEQVLLNGIFPAPFFTTPKVTVIVEDAEAAQARWSARHPHMTTILDVSFHQPEGGVICWADADDPVMTRIEAITPTIHVFAGGESEQTLVAALALRDAMRRGARPPAPIVVRSDHRRLTGQDLAAASGVLQLRVTIVDGYDAPASVFGIVGRIIEGRARAFHAIYAETSDPLAFDRLPHTQRLSNRRAAYHMLEKLRLLGFEDAWPRDAGYGLSARAVAALRDLSEEQLRDLDLLEHLRWRTDRFIEGWRAGPRNSERRLRDRLSDDWSHYTALAANERHKDRSQLETFIAGTAPATGDGGAHRIVDLHWEGPPPTWDVDGEARLMIDEAGVARLFANASADAGGADPRLCLIVPQFPLAARHADDTATSLRGALDALGHRLLSLGPVRARVRFLRPPAHPWDWLAPHSSGRVDGATLSNFAVGFVGHRDPARLGDIDHLLTRLRADLVALVPPGTRLFTGLADGGDRLMATLWRHLALGPITGIVPFWHEGPALGSKVTDVVPASVIALCDTVERPAEWSEHRSGDEQHAAVADTILARSTLLCAVSDGFNGGPGGVEDSVAKARARRMPLRYIGVG